jgi:hypothetical protein
MELFLIGHRVSTREIGSARPPLQRFVWRMTHTPVLPSILIPLGLALLLLSACSTQEVVRANALPATRAQQPVAENRLLDVGIVIFDPGLPEDRKELTESNIFPDVRKAEARCIPYTLKRTLAATRQWGALWLVPDSERTVDLMVTGRIVNSDGEQFGLDVAVTDATGTTWLKKHYAGTASKYAYSDEHFREEDPFQNVYNSIANDLLTARDQLTGEALERIRTIAELRFAQDFSPDAFAGYLVQDPPGQYSLNRLPADGDPMLSRVRIIRARDAMLLDTLDGHYAAFCREMEPSYREWRKSNFEETLALQKLERSARNRMVMGGAATVAGVAGGLKSGSTAGQVVSAATAVGGVAVFASGVEKYSQSRIHADALRELGDSLDAAVAPMVVDVEGRTVTLAGSAETQYHAWRRLLSEIYAQETGLPPTKPAPDSEATE